MSGYGKDIKMAFFNAPDEARFKLFKVIESSDDFIKYAVLAWTTTSAHPQLLGRFSNVEPAIKEFNRRIERWREVEPQFQLVTES